MLKAFIEWNRRLSYRVTPRHVMTGNVFAQYGRVAPLLMSAPDVRTVADVGAGKRWHFPSWMKSAYGIKLIGLDIDDEEMAPNEDLDVKLECDVTRAIPLAEGSVDLITAYSGLEHFSDNAAFLRHAFTALRPGGALVAQFPSSIAPFALLNRSLPPRLRAWLLREMMPGNDGVLGFKAHYDRTRPSRFRRMARETGFEIEHHYPGYYSSAYFTALFPVYLLSYLFDMTRYMLGVRELASYNLVVLRKPGPHLALQLDG